MRLRRHPVGVELGAWFDGEEGADVGGHLAGCARCRRRVSEMARVRAWIRAQPFFAMGDEPAGAERLRTWRPRMAALAAVLAMVLLVPNAQRGARSPESGRERGTASAPLLNSGTEGEARPPEAPGEPLGGSSASPGLGPRDGRARPTPGLRLGLVVPGSGPLAQEGDEVTRAVRRGVELANASGGVGGRPVELVVVDALDEAAVKELPRRVSALVGGFGARRPPDVAWLLPADASVTGADVVPAEASPHAVGNQMGEALRRQLLLGPVGVVVGPGPEAAMGTGLASKVPTATVAAPAGSGCATEVAALRRARSVALAVAGPPELAVRCLRAAAHAGWRPMLGTIVAPSAAYAGLDRVAEARGARTLLALPWPNSPASGAARFRASVSGARSYRALVSFAATELAVQVARQESVSVAAVARGTWRSDLVELRGTEPRATQVVAAVEGWVPAPDGLRIGPITLPPLPVLGLP